jgi:hypothetical protein
VAFALQLYKPTKIVDLPAPRAHSKTMVLIHTFMFFLGLKPFTRFMNGSYLGNIQFYFILHHHPPLHLENPRLQYQGC